MNAYHEALEAVLTESPGLATQAPAEYQQQPAFREQLQAVQGSVQMLRTAVRQGDVEAIRKALGVLKGPYSRSFLNFG